MIRPAPMDDPNAGDPVKLWRAKWGSTIYSLLRLAILDRQLPPYGDGKNAQRQLALLRPTRPEPDA